MVMIAAPNAILQREFDKNREPRRGGKMPPYMWAVLLVAILIGALVVVMTC